MASDNLLEFILEDEKLSASLLVVAINKGNMELIEKIVDSLPSIDKKKRDDIIWGAIKGTLSKLTSKVFGMLMKNGPSTYCTTKHYPCKGLIRLNLLDYFVTKQRNDLLRILLGKYDINLLVEINDYDHRWHNTPHLFTALMDNNYDGAKLLMEYGADINQLCKIKGTYGGFHGGSPPTLRCLPGYKRRDEPCHPLCYNVLKYHSEENRDALIEFMLDFGADLSDLEKLRECNISESTIKKVEEFYKEPKKRAKPDQD